MIHQIVRAALAGALLISFGHVFAADCRVEAVAAILDSRSIKQLDCAQELNGRVYFPAEEATTGTELWTSDGTSAGTFIVKDIVPGAAGSQPTDLTVVNGRLYFQATDLLYGTELWESDGTAAGTQITADVMPGPLGSYPGAPVSDGVRTLFFAATDREHGREVWAFDTGTRQARLVRDVLEGPDSSYPSYLTMYRGTLFFGATNIAHGSALWKSDGTAAGTVLFADLMPGQSGERRLYDLTVLDGRLYFRTFDLQSGAHFFASNGVPGDVVALAQDPYKTRAALSWTAPKANMDNTPLTNLAGYAVYHWTDADPVPVRVDVGGAAANSHTFTGLAPGMHYFAVTAISLAGEESSLSSTATKLVQ